MKKNFTFVLDMPQMTLTFDMLTNFGMSKEFTVHMKILTKLNAVMDNRINIQI